MIHGERFLMTSRKNSALKPVVAIPARIGSTRLPRKVLLEINGKPMLHHVIERCLETELVEEVFVVTDSQEVYDSVSSTSAKALMSDPDCSSGTERIASVIDQLPGEIIVNVQADQPVVEPDLIDSLIYELVENEADIATPVWKIRSAEDLEDDSLAKVVRDHKGYALYFSRSPIPFLRDIERMQWTTRAVYWSHYGIYAYTRKILETLDEIPIGVLEQFEKLEQLRFLENDFKVMTVETSYRQMAVDTYEDLKKMKQNMR